MDLEEQEERAAGAFVENQIFYPENSEYSVKLARDAFTAGAKWERERPDEYAYKIQAKIASAFDDKAIASIKNQLSDLYNDCIHNHLEWSMKEDLASNISGDVVRRVYDAVKALLSGNEDEMRRYLGIASHWDGRKSDHIQMIHGQLFETESIRLRREIVTKHADLIANERIKDLEAQLAALLEINRRQEVRIAELLEER